MARLTTSADTTTCGNVWYNSTVNRIQYSYFLGIVIALVLFIQGQLYFSKTSILTQQMMARHLEYPGIST